MEDMILRAKIDSETFVYVSPISSETYEEQLDIDNLGGRNGYFVLRSKKIGLQESLDVLAKAASFEAAGELFDMIVGAKRVAHT